MRYRKPIHIAAFAALIYIGGTLLLFIVLSQVFPESLIFPLIFSILLSGLIGYSYTLTMIRKHVSSRIKVLQKNIHETKVDASKAYQIPKKENFTTFNEEVTEWKENYRAEIDELKNRERFRREFIGNVSHELKTPIFNIQGYILTLLDGGLDDQEINLKYLKRASKSVDRMIDLVQDMDTINKLESGVMDFSMIKFDLLSLTKDVMDMMEDKAAQSKVKLNIKPTKEKTMMVMGDPNRIEQVLFNLVINAIKYNKTNGGIVNISFFDMDEQYLIEVTDNGIGIPESDLPRVFERFYRVDKSRVRYTGGSGLGLSIVKHIIDLHNQSINLRSTENVGTTISFTLAKAS